MVSDGTVYVHFYNYQNESAWEVSFDFDAQIMVVKSTDNGQTWSDPVLTVQLEDGLSDMPWSVIARQTIWGHEIRWNAAGNIVVDLTNPTHLIIVFANRGTPNSAAAEGYFLTDGTLNIGDPPTTTRVKRKVPPILMCSGSFPLTAESTGQHVSSSTTR